MSGNEEIFKKQLEALRDLVKLQGQSGNWNYDPYMHGMFNGMEFALSILEDREPEYRAAPEVWLKDISIEGPVAEAAESDENNNQVNTLSN